MGNAPLNHQPASGAALAAGRVGSASGRSAITRSALALCLALAGLMAQPAAQAAAAQSAAAAAHPSRGYWVELKGTPAQRAGAGLTMSVQPTRYRATSLDRAGLSALLATAPAERSRAASLNPLVVSLPNPAGGFERFALSDSPVMEAGLAARHPEIKTYAGQGIDDPKASLRMSVTPLGVHVSVLSPKGSWYAEPLYHLNESVYASYYRADLPNVHGTFAEGTLRDPLLSLERGLYRAADAVKVGGAGFAPGAQVTITVRNTVTDYAPRQTVFATASRDGTVSVSLVADPYKNLGSYEVTATDGKSTVTTTYQVVGDGASTNAVTGGQLRTYRLALVTDPSYATYFGGSANVTPAKVALVNRLTQVYESETSIRLVLIAGTDALNLDTAAQMTGTNGPCGGAACFSATQAAGCASSTLTRNRVVVGLLAGASNYDIGHIAFGLNGGGIASLGVVGGSSKAQGCTGIPTPVGDAFAVDYVAHEMGHQFAGNHTFNGVISNCSGGNRNAGTSVEPGSGSSIMAYAGICGTDDLQPHSDPYWSQRSFDEITTYTSGAESTLNEVQNGVLTGYTANGLQFQLRYNGNDSVAIVRGTNYTVAGIKAAVEAIAGWPAGGTVTASTVGDTAFTLTFGGALIGVNVAQLQLVNCTGGCTGYVGEITKGGLTTRGGTTVTGTGNSAPVVTAAATYTIPVRTPFALTGSATDPDSDAITYLWEQNDRASANGTGLVSNTKLDGPLFRQFGKQAVVSTAQSLLYNSPGENLVDGNPTRVFPDMAQILANNTNAETGVCPTASATPTAAQIDCYSEFLPTAAYVGFAGTNAAPASLNFRLTARDGKGGVNSANTQLILAAAAGPFLVTSPNTAVTLDGTSTQTVSWSVANTDIAPVSAANVKITLSVDGGLTYPYTLAASTPNNGSKAVVLPNLNSSTARVKVEAVGNVFFDVSNANFTIRLTGDVDGDGVVGCSDLATVKAAMGKSTGQPGFDARADVNNDGVVNIRDLAYVSQRVAPGTSC